MVKTLYSLLLLFCLISCGIRKNSRAKTNSNSLAFESIYPHALRGEMHKVFEILDTLTIENLNEEELEIKRKYYKRFISKTEKYDYNTSDTTIINVVDMFHSYWNDVMINNEQLDIADSLFIESMSRYLFNSNRGSSPQASIKNNIYNQTNSFLKERGYYSNAFGKTGYLFDLFLWKTESVKNYTVELLDENVNVTVYLMDDFISTGWSHYTTFGKSYTGGWANREALYCVVNAYDTESENYQISYLTHEGQHFYDYEKYPNLIQKDLEYRAKLVELAKSKTTTKQIIRKFVINASNQPENAHAFANYCVIRDLSKLLFNKNYTKEKSDWMSIDSELIRVKSEELFRINTNKLDAIGSKVVRGLIK